MRAGRFPRIVWLLLRQALLRATAGICAGMFAAWWLAQPLNGVLGGSGPLDRSIFVPIAGVLMAAALAAVWLPTARVLRLDPSVALRSD